jgi:hypothetical protein
MCPQLWKKRDGVWIMDTGAICQRLPFVSQEGCGIFFAARAFRSGKVLLMEAESLMKLDRCRVTIQRTGF